MSNDITALTPEKLAEIRQRYSPVAAPKCHICGAEMEIGAMSASRTVYACSGATHDDKGWHYAPGRSLADDHYSQSRVTVVDVSDPDVLSLVEALEKAQTERDEFRHRLKLERAILEDADKRIAELEKAATEPVAWTDEQELRDVESNGFAYLFTVNPITPHADPRRVIKLYTVPPALESRIVTAAASDVLAERQRQISMEGWTPESDDRYTCAELSIAAQCYAAHHGVMGSGVPVQWPWEDEWWKPSNRRRNLVKAGALIIAEIERLDRAEGEQKNG